MNEERFKKLNVGTKKANDYCDRYFQSYCESVIDAYKTRPSNRKIEIEKDIKEEMKDNNGRRYRIIGAGQTYFTCGYLVGDSPKCKLVVETPSQSYLIDYSKYLEKYLTAFKDAIEEQKKRRKQS